MKEEEEERSKRKWQVCTEDKQKIRSSRRKIQMMGKTKRSPLRSPPGTSLKVFSLQLLLHLFPSFPPASVSFFYCFSAFVYLLHISATLSSFFSLLPPSSCLTHIPIILSFIDKGLVKPAEISGFPLVICTCVQKDTFSDFLCD